MSEPKHSLHLAGQCVERDAGLIRTSLNSGVKVILFTEENLPVHFVESYREYGKKRLLQIYPNPKGISLDIIDGEVGDNGRSLAELSNAAPNFNYEQYQIEHSKEDHIIVRAGAGTGKTSVMIDRVMYLIDMCENVSFSDITMITFTNDATNQMNQRLQQALRDRYELATDSKYKSHYLRLLEEQSDINIVTIDSFSLQLLKKIGTYKGYGKKINVRSYAYELKDMNQDVLDELSNTKDRVKDQMGLQLYQANPVILDFWKRLMQLGLSDDEIQSLDWGTTDEDTTGNASRFQEKMVKAISSLRYRYSQMKQRTDSVMISESLRELTDILENCGMDLDDLGIKYLFIDEFQDSNNAQIRMASLLVKNAGVSLFAVGDTKQSIYRFRGANDTAFDALDGYFDRYGIDGAVTYTLLNNYRSSKDLIGVTDSYFRSWNHHRLLDYDGAPRPCCDFQGIFRTYQVRKDKLGDEIYKVLSEALKDKKKGERIAVLVRYNWQIEEIRKACNPSDKRPITLMVRSTSGLFGTRAARDLYHMVASFVFGRDPMTTFNYLVGPYSSFSGSIDVNGLMESEGSEELLNEQMDDLYLSNTNWATYNEDFRYKPAVSVIKDIIKNESVLWNHISHQRSIDGATDESVMMEARQYSADLDKLIEIIQTELSGDYTSLYEIYEYLKYALMTNRDEQQPDITDIDDDCVLCMTVHKAKGLEFDTVLIPFDTKIRTNPQTQIVLSRDDKRIGWQYAKGEWVKKDGQYIFDVEEQFCNDNYEVVMGDEIQRIAEEETRLLYVAMTRAKRKLICLQKWASEEVYSWRHLLVNDYRWADANLGGRE